ncbi:thioesterase [Amylibacter marinus]|uniref:Thioesterase n=1 Tax=Amylibacter marinus TaxID=1475483 RepID=A0ABQ5VW98_9RHOB|nr:acyl-CoA thioesterase [Amylibacter marinus]GLQ35368.1 thioesterase [Amylibacter marinus]
MYPFVRLALEYRRAKRQGRLTVDQTHECTLRIWPQDLDVFNELNNGRILTLFDVGRLPFGWQVGLLDAMKENKWGLTMAGASVRYRRRVHLFDKVKIKTTAMGRDARFIYILQTMYRAEEATSSILYRSALTDRNGIVPPQKFADYLGVPDWNPEMPEWAQNWIAAENTRVWPPVH